MLRFVLGFIGFLFSYITLGAIFAFVAIGGILWIYSRDLPSHESLAQYTPPTISRIYSAEGRMIDEFAQERRLYASSEEIPDLVKQAFISAEDKNFYNHQGFDPRALAGAIYEAVATKGQRVRGASGITQQVAKNLLLSSDRTAERKIKELILSMRIDQALSKDKVLEIYLNEIFLGLQSYGVAAAAQTYFNKSLAELNPQEAAFLAMLPKEPSNRHPVQDRETALFWRDNTLREMFENGYITREDYDVALADPLLTVQNGDYEPFRSQLPPRDYFTDEIRRQLSAEQGQEDFFTGGYTVRASVDPEMQVSAASSLRRELEKYDRNQGVWRGTGQSLEAEFLGDEATWREALSGIEVPRDIDGWFPAVVLSVGDTHAKIGIEGVPNDEDGHWIAPEDVTWARKDLGDGELGSKARVAGDLVSQGDVVLVRAVTDDSGAFVRWTLRQVPELQGGFVAMDVNTGRVIAMQGGFSYQHSSFNRATQASRQPGSSFKPFVYAAALDSGFTPATIVIDAPIEVDTGDGIWRPKNASNRFYGPSPLRTGIEQSRNLMTVRLAQEVGMYTIARYAERFGVYDNMQPFLANALGSEETTLYKMTAAYAMFANGGERIEPTLVDRVQDRFGRSVYRHDRRVCEDCDTPDLAEGLGPRITSNNERVMNAITAYQLTSMLKGVVDRGTASGSVNLPVPVAGKTGTTNDARDVWFVGFTSNIVAGCYMGYDQPRPMGRGASGGGMCGPVFQRFMRDAVEKYGGGPFKVPPGGNFIKIDRYSGQRLHDGASGPYVVAEYFREGEEPFGFGFLDGGFAMGSDLVFFDRGESEVVGEPEPGTQQVTTSTGNTATLGGSNASFGSLSSGGLY